MANGPKPRAGILDHTGEGLGGAQLVAVCMAAALNGDFSVDLIHAGNSGFLARAEAAFGVDLHGVNERCVAPLESFQIPGNQGLGTQLRTNSAALTRPYDLFIYSGHGVPPFCKARRGMVYCHFPIETAPLVGLEQDPSWTRRSHLDRSLRGAAYQWTWKKRMEGYKTIIANSRFTATCIRQFWGESAHVVFPPVELSPPHGEKTNTIISIGRFTRGRRSKLQLEQVQAFRKFVEAGNQSWTLVLAGSCSDHPADGEYLKAVQAAAAGLPVKFLINRNRSEIVEALASAKIFWHTVGLGLDQSAEPALAEHFGIATVEAMCAACVPVVIPSGGQAEIVEDGISGFHVHSLDELVARTGKLAADAQLMLQMAGHAGEASSQFSRSRFDSEFRKLAGGDAANGPNLGDTSGDSCACG